jgi:hypothetical protein
MSQSEEEKNLNSSRPVPPLSQLLIEQKEVLDRIDKLLKSLPETINAYCREGYEVSVKRNLLLTLKEEFARFNQARIDLGNTLNELDKISCYIYSKSHEIYDKCSVTVDNTKNIAEKVDKLGNTTSFSCVFSALTLLTLLILLMKAVGIF